MGPPAFADLGIFTVPGVCERIQRHRGGFFRRRLIDGFQPGSNALIVFPRYEFQAVAYHVDIAKLDMCLRVDAVYRLRVVFQTIHTGDKDVL